MVDFVNSCLQQSNRRQKRKFLPSRNIGFSILQLTDLEPVPLPREVEFFRACKNPVIEEAYFWHELKLIALNLETLDQKVRPRTHPDEITGHEYWFKDGETIGYHGYDGRGQTYLGHIRYDNTAQEETKFSAHTGHIFSIDEKLIVGDGEGVIKLWQWDGSSYDGPKVLCEHGSSMQIQHSHPHPRFTDDGSKVLYTSDITGYCNLYLAEVPEFDSLPYLEEVKNAGARIH